MHTHQEFIDRYDPKRNNKTKARYNKAIRTETPGGDVLLDTLELVNQARQRRIEDLPDFLALIEDRLQQIREAAIEALKQKYNFPT